MRVLVLQHIACEPPAAFEDELRSLAGQALHTIEAWYGWPVGAAD
jgi:hypothetical protein